ncbi:hypothetical protein TNCV_788261 [Trichonephila clavipes]|nr:hypothetical protein TNCV_788261 [Trichonephila clavipes]
MKFNVRVLNAVYLIRQRNMSSNTRCSLQIDSTSRMASVFIKPIENLGCFGEASFSKLSTTIKNIIRALTEEWDKNSCWIMLCKVWYDGMLHHLTVPFFVAF